MAEISESPSSSTDFPDGTDPPSHITTSLKFVIDSIKNLTQTPLTSDNYSIWSTQILRIFRANGFDHFLEKTNPTPSEFILTAPNTMTKNPQHRLWTMTDQNLSAALLSTVSLTILPYANSQPTTADIWETLRRRLQSSSRSRIIQLKTELHNITMQDKPMRQYLSDIKIIVDSLASAGDPISHEDIILYTLNGLPPTYQGFKTAIRTRTDPLPIDDFYALLGSEEVNIAMEHRTATTSQLAAMTISRGRGSRITRGRRGGFSGRGRTNHPDNLNNTRPPRSTTICQICGKQGHSPYTC